MPVDTDPIKLTDGVLYITPKDGGGPILLGHVLEAEQTTYSHEYVDELGVRDPVVAVPEFETIECTVNPETISLISLWRLTHDIRVVLVWAQENRPKLLHLATYANTCRKRRKNITRVLREFFWEVQHETQRS